MPKPTKQRRSKKRGKRTPGTTSDPGTESATELASKGATPFGAKAKFIRAQPIDMPASAVIARAQEAGIDVSENHVYATRQKMKAETQSPRKGAKPSTSRGNGVDVSSSADKRKLIEQLESTIFRIGWEDAHKVFVRMGRTHYIQESS